jgi:hypothetical protein
MRGIRPTLGEANLPPPPAGTPVMMGIERTRDEAK